MTAVKEKKSGTERNSNFELLRIVAMLLIIMFHIIQSAVIYQLTDAVSISRMNNGWFNQPVYYKKLFLPAAIYTFGPIGNNLFILISGYFMRAKDYHVNLAKTAEKLLTQLLFAAALLVAVSTVVCRYFTEFREGYSLVGITAANSMSWFLGYYFIIILLGVLFLNKYLLSFDRKEYLAFVLSMLALISFSWSFSVLEGFSSLGHVATGIFFYALGGYIREYEPFENVRIFSMFVVIFVCYFLIFISEYNSTQMNIESFQNDGTQEVYYQSITGYNQNNGMIPILVAVCLFEIFRRIRMPKLKFVNFLGRSTLMVYLIHENDFFHSIWRWKDWISDLYYTPWHFLLKVAELAMLMFFIGVMGYILYIIAGKVLYASRRLFLK